MKLKYLPLIFGLMFARAGKAQDTHHEIAAGYDTRGYISLDLKEKIIGGISVGPSFGYNPKSTDSWSYKHGTETYSASETGEGYYYGGIIRCSLNDEVGLNFGLLKDKYTYRIDETHNINNKTTSLNGQDIAINNYRIVLGVDADLKDAGLDNLVLGFNIIFNSNNDNERFYKLIKTRIGGGTVTGTKTGTNPDLLFKIGYNF